MDSQRFSIVLAMISISFIANLAFSNVDFSKEVIGQAEETFDQNATTMKETEEIASENSGLSSENQTQSLPLSQNDSASILQTDSILTSILSSIPSNNRANENQTIAAASGNQTNGSLPITRKTLSEAPEGPDSAVSEFDQPSTSIVISGENVYVVWWNNRTGNLEVMFRASNDRGQTFGDEVNLSSSPDADSENAALLAAGKDVFVSWRESSISNGTSESVFRISNDSGATFGPILKSTQTIGQRQVLADFLTYENSSYGIKVEYPSDWRLRPGEANNDGVTDIAGFYAPFENRLDNYQERVWISKDILLGQNMTLEDYSDRVVSHNNATLRNFTLLDRDTDFGVLADHPAYRLVYTSHTQDGSIIKQLEIGTIINDEVYYLIYYAEPDKYRGLLPVVRDMINSFEINQ
jgi:hypothetical protein